MPIKWSALKVSEAMDMLDEMVNQAAEPLAQARIVAREARQIRNLPHYIAQRLLRIIAEIDVTIGSDPGRRTGRLRTEIESIRALCPMTRSRTRSDTGKAADN